MLRNKSITLHLKNFPIYVRQLCSKPMLSQNQSEKSNHTNMFECLKEKMKAIQHHPQHHRSSLRVDKHEEPQSDASSTNLSTYLEQKMKEVGQQDQKKKVSIYRVPA